MPHTHMFGHRLVYVHGIQLKNVTLPVCFFQKLPPPTGLQSTSDLYLNPLLLAAITDMLHL